MDASAYLQLGENGGTKGLLLPRVSLTNTTTFGLTGNTQTAGMHVYNTNTTNPLLTGADTVKNVTPGEYYWTGAQWLRIPVDAWTVNGNAGTTGLSGISLTTNNPRITGNFVGTTDTASLIFGVNNILSGIITMQTRNAVAGRGITALGGSVSFPPSDYQATLIGGLALSYGGGRNIAIGSVSSAGSGGQNVSIGAFSGGNVGTGNLSLGAFSGFGAFGSGSVNTGNPMYNICIGAPYSAGGLPPLTGSYNIMIGNTGELVQPGGSGQLNIGNLITGTGMDGQPNPGVGINLPGAIQNTTPPNAPNATLQVNGTLSLSQIRTLPGSGSTTINDFCVVETQAGSTVTLVSPTSTTMNNNTMNGVIQIVSNASSGSITVSGAGVGGTVPVPVSANSGAQFICDGTYWYKIN